MKTYGIMVEFEVEAESSEDAVDYLKENLKGLEYYVDFVTDTEAYPDIKEIDEEINDWVKNHLS